MDARPFRGVAVEEEEEAKEKEESVVFRGADRTGGECAASECKLIAKDFWARGFDRWVVCYPLSLRLEDDMLIVRVARPFCSRHL